MESIDGKRSGWKCSLPTCGVSVWLKVNGLVGVPLPSGPQRSTPPNAIRNAQVNAGSAYDAHIP